jgi:integrase
MASSGTGRIQCLLELVAADKGGALLDYLQYGFTETDVPALVILNRIAGSVIAEQRKQHPAFVFTYQGQAIRKMNGHAWRKARQRAGLPGVRVHDLEHTFGRRLRAAGVSFEDRQDLLGHKSGRITTHYSAAELHNLIKAANSVTDKKSRKSPALTFLNRKTG